MLSFNIPPHEFQSEEETNSLKDKIEDISNKVFVNYSNYSEEEKRFLIPYQNLFKLFRLSGVISNINTGKTTLSPTKFELIVRSASVNKHIFNFDDFLSIIVSITKQVKASLFENNNKKAVLLFVNEYLAPLANQGRELSRLITTDRVNSNKSFSYSVNENYNCFDINSYSIEAFEQFFENFELELSISKVFNSIYNAIFEIYSQYFIYELRQSTDYERIKKESLKSLLKFMKDFEVLPYFIGLNAINKYWKVFNNYKHLEIFNEERNSGTCFKISSFAVVLTHLSYFFYWKKYIHIISNNNSSLNNSLISNSVEVHDQHSEVDKVLLFMEYLKNSKGYQKIAQLKIGSKEVSLIPSLKLLREVGSTAMFPKYSLIKSMTVLDFNSNKFLNILKKEKRGNSISLLKSDKVQSDLSRNDNLIKFNNNELNLNDLLEIKKDTMMLIENTYLPRLQSIFDHYSKIGDKLSIDSLSYTSWSNICQLLGIIKKQSQTAVYINKNLILKKD